MFCRYGVIKAEYQAQLEAQVWVLKKCRYESSCLEFCFSRYG